MNLFRSEEHVSRWPQLLSSPEEGTVSLADVLVVFGSENRRHLLDGDYISHWLLRRGPERREALERIGRATPLWLGS